MIIQKNLKGSVVSISASIQEALKRINENKHKIVYAVDDKNHLMGSLTDGDVRRWILTVPEIDLQGRISSIINQPCFSMAIESSSSSINSAFNERINSIPLIDKQGHLVAIASPETGFFNIDNRRISNEDPVFIIAEIGNNHQGDVVLAKKLVDLAVAADVDCVKFQMRNISNLYRNDGLANDVSADLGTQYTLDLLSKYQLTDQELFEVFDYCKEKKTIPLCTPWDLDSLDKLEGYGMSAYKVASADFTNYELLGALAKTGKPLICSTGMSNENEIYETVGFLRRNNAQFVLLHCNSTYPTPFKDVRLNYLNRLKKITGSVIGYSGHERGWAVPVAAVALGAKVIEKHFTMDKNLEGNDHKVSLLPEELKYMVVQIRQVEQSLGDEAPREVSQGEMINREVLAKSMMINQDLAEGEIITREMIEIKSPGQGLQPNRMDELVGKKATRDFHCGDLFFETDIKGGFKKKSRYIFNRPYGIPVRYHDYKTLIQGIDLDFVEFHLSFKDLKVHLDEFLTENLTMGFAVHAPELFAGDHLMDLSAEDNSYRNHSIQELDRVIRHTRDLKKYFPNTANPVIVVNVGGWNTDRFLDSHEKQKKYNRVKDAFEQVDLTDIRIAIQTMPPFPWHFGGQSYHNLFLEPNEIKRFCETTALEICLDISHTMMACNYYDWDLYDFVEKVGPYVAHLHIVDAKGSDGEGVQVGEGDVDFNKLAEALRKSVPGVQFIPEVWQGHKNRGEGFWNALGFLERHCRI